MWVLHLIDVKLDSLCALSQIVLRHLQQLQNLNALQAHC